MRPPCDEGLIRSAPDSRQCSHAIGLAVLAAAIIGSSMTFIDGTVVNVALPVLRQQLAATAAEAQWIVEAYMLFLASLILVGGALGDRWGDAECSSSAFCSSRWRPPGAGWRRTLDS